MHYVTQKREEKRADGLFKEIKAENVPNFGRNMDIQRQESQTVK